MHAGTSRGPAFKMFESGIRETGLTAAKVDTATGGGATNYTVDDGSGPVALRVVDDLSAPVFNVGDKLVGRGAGSEFSGDFQILIGRASDISVDGGGGPDLDPPTIASVFAPSDTRIDVGWSETVTTATADVVGNYEVFETSNSANTVAVTLATTSTARTSTSGTP